MHLCVWFECRPPTTEIYSARMDTCLASYRNRDNIYVDRNPLLTRTNFAQTRALLPYILLARAQSPPL